MKKIILDFIWNEFLAYHSGDEGSKQLTDSIYQANYGNDSYLITIMVDKIKK